MKIVFLFAVSCLISFVGCKDQETTYKEFVIPGGITYAGKPKDVKVYPGKYRVALKWAKGSDPKLKYARVFWNNYGDSLEVKINSDQDTIKLQIDKLIEQDYVFLIKSYDQDGNASVPVEVLTRVYGDKYQSSIDVLNRGLTSADIDANDKITMRFGPANLDLGALATELKYTDEGGNEKIALLKTKEDLLEITDSRSPNNIEFRTLYSPDSLCIDTFYTISSQVGLFNFVKTGWKIVAFSSQHDAGTNGVNNFIDGKDATRWHTKLTGPGYPQFATIDLGKQKTIGRISLMRTTYDGGDVRGPTKVQFMVSNDNQNWTDLGRYAFNSFVNGEQKYEMPSFPSARYVKFIGLEGPNIYMVMGEISVYVK